MSNNKQSKKYFELPHRETVISTNTLQTKPFDNQKIKIMSNNKQSSVEWLAIRLKEKMQVWNSTKNYQEFHIVLEAGEFAKLINEATAMHKQEIVEAYYMDNEKNEGFEYYKAKFGGNNE